MDIINWWNNLDPLSNEEKSILSIGLDHNGNENSLSTIPTFSSDSNFNILTDEYFNRMPFCNCSHLNKNLSFNISATSFIKMIFEKEVNDDTLIITSDTEHPSVKDIIKKYKNVLTLNHYTIIRKYNFNDIIKESKKYKKVFVYIIGTRNDTGEITPQQFFIDLKNLFIKNNINHIIVCDDVQGMFVIPRDYSIFDYVIGTAHAMITNFDMGILISNKNIGGYKAYNWGKWYLERLDILLKRKNKMNLFKTILEQYYDKVILETSQPLNSPAIFYMKIKNKNISEEISQILSRINLLIPDSKTSQNSFIRLRSHWFLIDNTLLPKCINVIEYILKNNDIDINKIKEIIC